MAAETLGGKPVAAARRARGRGTMVLLLAPLLVALLAIVAVAGANYFSGAHAAAKPPSPPRPQRIYLMTEGALEMEMMPLAPGTPSAARMARLERIVQQARQAVAPYHDIAAAVQAGYETAPDLLVDTQGQHYFQPQYLEAAATGHFDPTHPPFLVYNSEHGNTVLSGALYYMPTTATPAQLAAIFPPSLAAWHQHINVCVTGGTSLLDGTAVVPIHDQATCVARGGSFLAKTGWMVHLWLNQPMGRNLFAMDKPR